VFATGRLLKKAPKLNFPTMDGAALGRGCRVSCRNLGVIEAVILKLQGYSPLPTLR
jgi:hypothetical protein